MYRAPAPSTHQQTLATARGSDMTRFNLLACLPGFIVQPETKTESSPCLVKQPESGKRVHRSWLTHFLQHESRSHGIWEQSPAYTLR